MSDSSSWGPCKTCKWWQIEPGATPKASTMGLCIEEKLQPFRLRVSGSSGCNRWMEGKPAEKDIMSPSGTLLEKKGATRDGGSYEARMGGVACWNAVMDENDYLVKKWNEFIAA